jgi:hypothetical protein
MLITTIDRITKLLLANNFYFKLQQDMLKYSKLLFGILICLTACQQKTSDKKIETALDAADVFIRTTLDGEFKKAEPLVVPTELNKAMFERYETFYSSLSPAVKQGYKQASYNINTLTDVNDSTTIINYSNSYMNKATNLKVVKQNNQWLVDFSYTADSTATN